MNDTNPTTVGIHLTPNAKNQIQLKVGNVARFLLKPYQGDQINWEVHEGSQNKIARWVVSFLEPGTVETDEARETVEKCDGSPLSSTPAGEAEYQLRGKPGDHVETYVVGAKDECFRFSVAVLGRDGELYALDPEIRVRPGDRGTG